MCVPGKGLIYGGDNGCGSRNVYINSKFRCAGTIWHLAQESQSVWEAVSVRWNKTRFFILRWQWLELIFVCPHFQLTTPIWVTANRTDNDLDCGCCCCRVSPFLRQLQVEFVVYWLGERRNDLKNKYLYILYISVLKIILYYTNVRMNKIKYNK